MSLFVTASIIIPDGELEESFIRSSGPGGQNVNKVASAVQLRFDVRGSPQPDRDGARGAAAPGRRGWTREGVLIITAQRFREQERNRADARARLADDLRRAATPKPRRGDQNPQGQQAQAAGRQEASRRDQARPRQAGLNEAAQALVVLRFT